LWDLGETDALTIGRRRREQARLREYLLGRRATASCDVCGRELPAALLVAAHIVRRADLDEERRKDFGSIAMLACSLGCDDLFELGYIVVDEAGIVKAGRAADTPFLGSAVELLIDNVCTAHNGCTAADFAEHARFRTGTEPRRRPGAPPGSCRSTAPRPHQWPIGGRRCRTRTGR